MTVTAVAIKRGGCLWLLIVRTLSIKSQDNRTGKEPLNRSSLDFTCFSNHRGGNG